MSDILSYTVNGQEFYHHGIKGMKWGRRRYRNSDGSLTPAGVKRYSEYGRIVRGHAGPSIVVGSNKRKLDAAKKDLDLLNKGGHLSVGLTKKRQDAYDARDRAALEKKISKLEAKEKQRLQKRVSKYKMSDLAANTIAIGRGVAIGSLASIGTVAVKRLLKSR